MNTYVDQSIFKEMETNDKRTLKTISEEGSVLLVFLRHFGCVFCKEALADLSSKRENFEKKGIQLIFVHMSENDVANEYFKTYNLSGVPHISDPFSRYYRAFGIKKATFSQLYGLSTWIRGYSAKQEGHQLELAKHLGDSTQMPGIFFIQNGEVREQFIHKLPSDRPNYDEFVNCCINA